MRLQAAALAACALLISCTSDSTTPEINGQLDPAMLQRAIHVRVDVARGTAEVVEPKGSGKASASLLGNDVVTVVTSAITRTSASSSRDLVTFDVAIRNLLENVTMTTPTFPPAPAGVTGVLLFPYSIQPLNGNGPIEASTDFDGAPHNFFNDPNCRGGDNDCFRYEAFPGELDFNQTTVARRVGFLMHKHITQFDVFFVVAADQKRTPVGGLEGVVRSLNRGAFLGATVLLTPGNRVATTIATGDYRFVDLRSGNYTATVSNLPSYCSPVAAQNVTVVTGATARLDFIVTCEAPPGNILGRVSSPQNGPIVNALVRVGSSSTRTDAGGGFLISQINAGTYTLSVSEVGATCTAPADRSVDVVSGQNIDVIIDVVCAPRPVPVGRIEGSVTSALRGVHAGVAVILGARSAVTDASGNYFFANVPVGIHEVRINDTVDQCMHPIPPQSTTVNESATSIVNFVLTCSPRAGNITGRITSGGASPVPLAGMLVYGGTSVTTVTDANGVYSFRDVPIGPFRVNVDNTNWPCNGETSNFFISEGATTTGNIELPCFPPQAHISGGGDVQRDFVALNGGGSTSHNRAELTYVWTLVNTNAVVGNSPSPTLPAPDFGSWTYRLTVNDRVASSSAEVTVYAMARLHGVTNSFVSSVGNDSNTGARNAPFRTIARALTEAGGGPSDIYVTGGTFNETPLALHSGVSIYGGFDADFQARSVVNQTSILAPGVGVTIDAKQDIILDRLIIRALPAATAFNAVIGMRMVGSQNVRITNSSIFAGDGTGGIGGTNGSTPAAGSHGASGQSGSSTSSVGGARGAGGGGGGNGGNGGFAAAGFNGSPGTGGFINGAGGAGGAVGLAGINGGDGVNAPNGATGTGGLSSFTIQLNGTYVGNVGLDGATAQNGGAGGGGGGGGGRHTCAPLTGCIDGVGGGGGGGGSGGSGGSGGRAAQPGKASIGLLIVGGSVIEIVNTSVTSGRGGVGGTAGIGGAGSDPGLGGNGGAGGIEIGAGGNGGRGGAGGTGGCGGAGAGGASIAVARNGTNILLTNVTLATGPGGLPGTACANGAGQIGASIQQHVF